VTLPLPPPPRCPGCGGQTRAAAFAWPPLPNVTDAPMPLDPGRFPEDRAMQDAGEWRCGWCASAVPSLALRLRTQRRLIRDGAMVLPAPYRGIEPALVAAWGEWEAARGTRR
jgi:hypothetical protein